MWQFPQTGNNSQGGFAHAGNSQQQFSIPGMMNMQALAGYPPGLLGALQSNGGMGMGMGMGMAAGTNQFMPAFGQALAGASVSNPQKDSSTDKSASKGSDKKKEEKTGQGKRGDSSSSQNPIQQNQNLQLAAMAGVNPQLLQYLHAYQQPSFFGNPGMLGGMSVGNEQGNGFNIAAQQAMMFAKQQQMHMSAQMALQARSKDGKGAGEKDDSSNTNPLAFAAGQAGMFNPAFGGFSFGQGPGNFGQFGGSLMNGGGPGFGVMPPDLLAMLGASNKSLDASQGSNATSTHQQKAVPGSSPLPEETKGNKKKAALKSEGTKSGTNKASAQQTPDALPNPSAMDVPSQSAAALIGEENRKGEKVRQNNPGYVSGPSKSKVGTTPQELPPLLKGKFVTKAPNCHDILCGRGNFVNNHVGNKNFREIVALHKVLYVAAPKHSKPMFARKIIDAVHALDPPGRFLAQEPSTKLWYELDNKKAMSKTRQALREGAPQIMKTIQVETGGKVSNSNMSSGSTDNED